MFLITCQPTAHERRSNAYRFWAKMLGTLMGLSRGDTVPTNPTYLNVAFFYPLVAACALLPRSTWIRKASVCKYARSCPVQCLLGQALRVNQYYHPSRHAADGVPLIQHDGATTNIVAADAMLVKTKSACGSSQMCIYQSCWCEELDKRSIGGPAVSQNGEGGAAGWFEICVATIRHIVA